MGERDGLRGVKRQAAHGLAIVGRAVDEVGDLFAVGVDGGGGSEFLGIRARGVERGVGLGGMEVDGSFFGDAGVFHGEGESTVVPAASDVDGEAGVEEVGVEDVDLVGEIFKAGICGWPC